jgi:transcriptional regulator with XRE-family HTH domain
MPFGEILKKLRIDNNLTQDDLADKLYVTRTAISKWETNNGYPSIDSLKLISNLFNITIDELVSDEDIENKKTIEKNNYKTNNVVSIIGLSLTAILAILSLLIKNNFITGIFTGLEILGVSLYVAFTELALMYYKDKKLTKKQTRFNKFREISASLVLFLILCTVVRKF